MSGSSKKTSKASWIECGDSYVLTSKKVSNSSFRSTNNENDTLDGTMPLQPFIQNRVLAAEATLQHLNDIKLDIIVKEGMIEIHPETMELCGMQIGNPVLVSRASNACQKLSVFRSWPSRNIAPGKVGLARKQIELLQIEPGHFLFVAAPHQRVLTASLVKLSPLLESKNASSFLASAHFQQYLSMGLERMYLIRDQHFVFIYFGKPFDFIVKEVQAADRPPSVADECADRIVSVSSAFAISKLANDLDTSLNFSNGNLNRDFGCNTASTPLKRHDGRGDSPSELHCCEDDNLRTFASKRLLCQVYSMNSHTSFEILSRAKDPETVSNDASMVSFKSVGGLKQQIQQLKDTVVLPLRKPELFLDSGGLPIRGMILHGPSGTGKSLLARAVATEAGAEIVTIRGDEIMSRYLGESEKQLREMFNEAKTKTPCVIVVDEIDTLCPRRDSSRTDAERRLVTCLCGILDDMSNSCTTSGMFVLATTNRLDAVDPAMRRPGRFDLEIEVVIPSETDRREILSIHLTDKLSEEDLDKISAQAHGYVGADLSAVCAKAKLNAIIRHTKQDNPTEKICVTVDDVMFGLKQIPPSAMRELIVQVPTVRWSDIGGYETVKNKLKQAVEWPLKRQAAFKRLGIDPPRGLLMYGPPGCSKTLTAKALATESGLNFISIKGPQLFSKYVGDSERAIRRLFSKARSAAPSVVFIDELDALAVERGSGNLVADRVLTAMLTEMDGVEKRDDVIVVAATNRPDMIDKALLRPGRIDRMLYVPLPDADARREIFRIRFLKTPVSKDVELEELVAKTEMYSGAEICSVCTEAALAALEEDPDAPHVSRQHFEQALSTVLPQTTEEKAKAYEIYGRTLQTRIC